MDNKKQSLRQVFCGLGKRPLQDGTQATVALFAPVKEGQDPETVRRSFSNAARHNAHSRDLAAVDVNALAARAADVESKGNKAQAAELRKGIPADRRM